MKSADKLWLSTDLLVALAFIDDDEPEESGRFDNISSISFTEKDWGSSLQLEYRKDEKFQYSIAKTFPLTGIDLQAKSHAEPRAVHFPF